ncbi:ABC transporter permease, partial [Streptomyces stelliscabiei]
MSAVREQLGLDEGPSAHLPDGRPGLARGDAGGLLGVGDPVLPQVTTALAVSVTLMLGALGGHRRGGRAGLCPHPAPRGAAKAAGESARASGAAVPRRAAQVPARLT